MTLSELYKKLPTDIKAKSTQHTLYFKKPSRTSRGILVEKDSWIIKLSSHSNPNQKGQGECSVLRGLSIDARPDLNERINRLCEQFNQRELLVWEESLMCYFPAIRFAFETAILDFLHTEKWILFPSDFTHKNAPIAINGLIWMGNKEEMANQIKEKIKQGFTCIKLKIGSLEFEQELDLLKKIRQEFSIKDIEIRVDANGAFHPQDAMKKLERLSKLNLHSIEQPIATNQWEEMAKLCKETPLPIALDEELIGVLELEEQKELLDEISPHFIILKPSLLGGFSATENWISLAEKRKIGWWVTSALESNIGLNAIAQWTFRLNNKMPQGLGTGQLFINNFPSPLKIENGKLYFSKDFNSDASF